MTEAKTKTSNKVFSQDTRDQIMKNTAVLGAEHVDKHEVAEDISDPRSIYGTPQTLLQDKELGREEKREILLTWKQNEDDLIRSAGEGLEGGNEPMLDDVMEALEKLEDK